MRIVFAFIMFVITGVQASSQCDKKVTWYGSKGEMYDTNGALLDTKTDSIFIETSPQKIRIKFKADEKDLEGTVSALTCDWKEPFKNGKIVYQTIVSLENGVSKAVFVLEAKDNKITLSLELEAMSDRKFLIYIDKYEEGK